MQVAFPFPVRLSSSVPRLEGQRLSTFTNIDGESFAQPALNAYWRIDMNVVATTTQAQMALSAFVTAMGGHATCVVPICTQWRPNNSAGRPLARGGHAPDFMTDHTGFVNSPFPGFSLRSAASHRDSYLEITKPELSQLMPGHFVSLGDRLHQVIAVSAINESRTEVRASVLPCVRGNYDVGSLVVVDQLRLICRLESGDQIGLDTNAFKPATLSFVEAF